ncbi:Uma2 family endonuclease [Thermoanaerobacter italicus]|nr:Uma2 family endonuclease [Thermoanaerobacter italicus]
MSLSEGKEAYTYEDYLNWPNEHKIEIINGQLYLHTVPPRIHQEISIAMSCQFFNYLKNKKCEVYFRLGVRLPSGNEKSDKEIKTVVEPDIIVVCDKSKLDDEGCKGAPDLIVEITSPSTAKIDKVEKFNLYEKHGVKEYWIVEPEIKLVTVFLLQENGRYGRPNIYTEEDKIKVSIFEDLIIDLKDVFNY